MPRQAFSDVCVLFHGSPDLAKRGTSPVPIWMFLFSQLTQKSWKVNWLKMFSLWVELSTSPSTVNPFLWEKTKRGSEQIQVDTTTYSQQKLLENEKNWGILVVLEKHVYLAVLAENNQFLMPCMGEEKVSPDENFIVVFSTQRDEVAKGDLGIRISQNCKLKRKFVVVEKKKKNVTCISMTHWKLA